MVRTWMPVSRMWKAEVAKQEEPIKSQQVAQ